MIANVTTLDDPDFTRRRSDVRGQLIGDQTERVLQTRASADFVKDLAYSIVPGCGH
jgi:hypothetical protein